MSDAKAAAQDGTKLKAINKVMEFTATHNNIERLKIKKSANQPSTSTIQTALDGNII